MPVRLASDEPVLGAMHPGRATGHGYRARRQVTRGSRGSSKPLEEGRRAPECGKRTDPYPRRGHGQRGARATMSFLRESKSMRNAELAHDRRGMIR